MINLGNYFMKSYSSLIFHELQRNSGKGSRGVNLGIHPSEVTIEMDDRDMIDKDNQIASIKFSSR